MGFNDISLEEFLLLLRFMKGKRATADWHKTLDEKRDEIRRSGQTLNEIDASTPAHIWERGRTNDMSLDTLEE